MEGCRTGGTTWHGTQMGMTGGGQEGRWCCRLLVGVEEMGRVLPQSHGPLPQDEHWLQGWTCPARDVCLDKTHSEHVADLSL